MVKILENGVIPFNLRHDINMGINFYIQSYGY